MVFLAPGAAAIQAPIVPRPAAVRAFLCSASMTMGTGGHVTIPFLKIYKNTEPLGEGGTQRLGKSSIVEAIYLCNREKRGHALKLQKLETSSHRKRGNHKRFPIAFLVFLHKLIFFWNSLVLPQTLA
jgi:hypothetical protein